MGGGALLREPNPRAKPLGSRPQEIKIDRLAFRCSRTDNAKNGSEHDCGFRCLCDFPRSWLEVSTCRGIHLLHAVSTVQLAEHAHGKRTVEGSIRNWGFLVNNFIGNPIQKSTSVVCKS